MGVQVTCAPLVTQEDSMRKVLESVPIIDTDAHWRDPIPLRFLNSL